MTETEIIDAVYENGVLKPLQKIEPCEGKIVEIRIRKVENILRETSGIFKGKYDKKMRYEMYDTH
ncbi:MAG: antitoxin family protein [Bacteroidales bacterium]|nr:antitoxin family protein [ANME-2 cluster archaeon]MDT8402846.1 antitoxin family protein [Bacteroidales bacterium]MDW7774888.1 antitoxin family protein [Methanosarcinales archaeon]